MNPIALELGNFQLHWYSIAILSGMIIGCFLFWKETKKQDLPEDFIINLLFYGIIIGILGARLYYVLFEFDYYLKYPIEIFEIWNGGLAIHGGLIAGSVWFIYYSKKHNVNFLKILDASAPAVLIAQALGRWGNFFNSEAHGIATTYEALKNNFIPEFIIQGMKINGIYYIPTFYYEFLWNLLGFILIIAFRKIKKEIKPGTIAGIYFMWYSFGRFFIEGMRTDSLMLGNIRIAQLMSIALFILGLFLIIYKRKTKIIERSDKNAN